MNPGQTIGAPAGRVGTLRSQVPARPRAAFGEREPARRGRGRAARRHARTRASPAQPLPRPAGERPARPHSRGERLGTRAGARGQRRRRAAVQPGAGMGRPGPHLPQPAAHLFRVRRERASHEHHGGERAAPARLLHRRRRGAGARGRRRHRLPGGHEPQQSHGEAGRRGVPLRAAGSHRRARDGGRGVLRILPHDHAPCPGAAREPGHPAHVFQGVSRLRASAWGTCWGTPRSSASS